MSTEILGLEPKSLWKYFYDLTQVPRPSKQEERIQRFMYDFGKSLGLETIKDKVGNVIIRKPATSGMEDRKGIILQAHLDMVPQKNAGVKHNFEKDPIKTCVKDGWVHAEETTLGADNGIGVAAIMAALADDNIEHGPIEALFTCDEETGMTGAKELEAGVLKGDILMNLDSEDEGELYVGCAGGLDAEAEYKYKTEECPMDYKGYEVHIKGLQGGHSGLDIHEGRANANKLLMRLLKLLKGAGVKLAEAEGGSLRNAIPREAYALVAVPTSSIDQWEAIIKEYEATIKKEYIGIEPEFHIVQKSVGTPTEVITAKDTEIIIDSLLECPNGVIKVSEDMEGLTETSNNMSRIEIRKGIMLVQCLIRSSSEKGKADLLNDFNAVFDKIGAQTANFGSYPGWQPNMQSPILASMIEVYENVFNKKPKIKAVHAGLECGLLGSVYPNWDMISFGPTIRNPHSPNEKVNIETVGKFWTFLKESLKDATSK